MNQRDFATAIGVSASTLNSMLKGHTSVTNTTVQAIHRRFPKINISWLMFEEGNMLVSESQEQTAAAVTDSSSSAQQDTPASDRQKEEPVYVSDGTGEGYFQNGNKEVTPTGQVIIREVKYIDKPQRRITEIRVFYDDGTFDTFPGKRD